MNFSLISNLYSFSSKIDLEQMSFRKLLSTVGKCMSIINSKCFENLIADDGSINVQINL